MLIIRRLKDISTGIIPETFQPDIIQPAIRVLNAVYLENFCVFEAARGDILRRGLQLGYTREKMLASLAAAEIECYLENGEVIRPTPKLVMHFC